MKNWAKDLVTECIERKVEFRIVVECAKVKDSGIPTDVYRGVDHIVLQFIPRTFDRNAFVLADETLCAVLAFGVELVLVAIPWDAICEIYTRHMREGA